MHYRSFTVVDVLSVSRGCRPAKHRRRIVTQKMGMFTASHMRDKWKQPGVCPIVGRRI